jgi:hypothetical protein
MNTDFLPRTDAADYLSRKLGVKVTLAALEQRATGGTGPAFRVVLGRAVYSRTDLDTWAIAQLSDATPHAKRRRSAYPDPGTRDAA